MPLKLMEVLLPIQLSPWANRVVGTNFHRIPLYNIEEMYPLMSCVIPPPMATKQLFFLNPSLPKVHLSLFS